MGEGEYPSQTVRTVIKQRLSHELRLRDFAGGLELASLKSLLLRVPVHAAHLLVNSLSPGLRSYLPHVLPMAFAPPSTRHAAVLHAFDLAGSNL